MTGFSVEPGYLDTASVGAPPDSAAAALRDAIGEWQRGRARPQDYDRLVTAAREAFARLVNVPAAQVCVGSQVSVMVGLVAASLPAGARVVCLEGDFTSLLFPFLAQSARGVETVLVAPDRLVESIGPGTSLVAVSAVQSATGAIADLDAICAAAARHGARTLVDITQACGWLPIDAARFDITVCSGYKWLLCPRGTAFMTVRGPMLDEILPAAAGWYAGEDIWDSIYGAPLRLATTARRLDVSPAWLCWVGAVPALEVIESVGVAAIHDHDLSLANRVRDRLGLPPGRSAIVRIESPAAADRLAAGGIRASMRSGAVRLSFHLYNTVDDAEGVADALRS